MAQPDALLFALQTFALPHFSLDQGGLRHQSNVLSKHNALSTQLDWFFDCVQLHFQNKVSKRFWQAYQPFERVYSQSPDCHDIGSMCSHIDSELGFQDALYPGADTNDVEQLWAFIESDSDVIEFEAQHQPGSGSWLDQTISTSIREVSVLCSRLDSVLIAIADNSVAKCSEIALRSRLRNIIKMSLFSCPPPYFATVLELWMGRNFMLFSSLQMVLMSLLAPSVMESDDITCAGFELMGRLTHSTWWSARSSHFKSFLLAIQQLQVCGATFELRACLWSIITRAYKHRIECLADPESSSTPTFHSLGPLSATDASIGIRNPPEVNLSEAISNLQQWSSKFHSPEWPEHSSISAARAELRALSESKQDSSKGMSSMAIDMLFSAIFNSNLSAVDESSTVSSFISMENSQLPQRLDWASFYSSLQPDSNLRRLLDWTSAFVIPFARICTLPLPSAGSNMDFATFVPPMAAINLVWQNIDRSDVQLSQLWQSSWLSSPKETLAHMPDLLWTALHNVPLAIQRMAVELSAARLLDSLFDLIRDSNEPNVIAALKDLSSCFSWTYPHLLHSANSKLSASLRQRLLHAGANTHDIVTQYLSLAKVLKELDPSGVLLDACLVPVRSYLRARPDSLRIITNIVTSASSTTLEDLQNEAAELETSQADDVDPNAESSSTANEGVGIEFGWGVHTAMGHSFKNLPPSHQEDLIQSLQQTAIQTIDQHHEDSCVEAGAAAPPAVNAPSITLSDIALLSSSIDTLDTAGSLEARDPDVLSSAAVSALLARIGHRTWKPDPLHADPSASSASIRAGSSLDCVGHLLQSVASVDDAEQDDQTKSLVLEEYQNLLAQRLLAATGFDVDQEWARVELLKLRFGESSMHGVEVMMKDIQESRRTNTNVIALLKAQASKRIQLASQHQAKRHVTSASPPVHSSMHGNMALFTSANALDSRRDFDSTDRRPHAALCFASVSTEPRSSTQQLRSSLRHSASASNPSQRLQFVTPDTPDVAAEQTSQFSASFDLSTSPISFDDQSAVRNKRRHESPDDQLSPIPTSDSSSFVRSPFVVGTRQSATAATLHFTPAASVQHSPPESHSTFVDRGLFSKKPAAAKSSTDSKPPPSASASDHLLNDGVLAAFILSDEFWPKINGLQLPEDEDDDDDDDEDECDTSELANSSIPALSGSQLNAFQSALQYISLAGSTKWPKQLARVLLMGQHKRKHKATSPPSHNWSRSSPDHACVSSSPVSIISTPSISSNPSSPIHSISPSFSHNRTTSIPKSLLSSLLVWPSCEPAAFKRAIDAEWRRIRDDSKRYLVGARLQDGVLRDNAANSHALSYVTAVELNQLRMLPAPVRQAMLEYASEYSHVKAERRLCWRPMLGQVTLELSLPPTRNDTSGTITPLTLVTTTVDASILYCFAEHPAWSITTLSARLSLDLTLLRQRLNFWTSKGLLRDMIVPAGVLASTVLRSVMPDASSALIDAIDSLPPSTDVDIVYAAVDLSTLSLAQRSSLIAFCKSTQRYAAKVPDVFGSVMVAAAAAASQPEANEIENAAQLLEQERKSGDLTDEAEQTHASNETIAAATAWQRSLTELQDAVWQVLQGLNSLSFHRLHNLISTLLLKQVAGNTRFPLCCTAMTGSRQVPPAILQTALNVMVQTRRISFADGVYCTVSGRR